ncbi:MAG TPA: hypothetical protein VMF69_20215 [Gemmataceae bacterium]|nr:hypothetical protein [Gemmataceae bacterium]
MIRRLLCACVGAVFLGTWVSSAHAVAKPPDLPEDGTVTATPDTSPPAPIIEELPMPHEDAAITCPYLRQQRIDRHACQIADPDMGREVLDNLKRLKQADNLLELAKDLARDGFLAEAMVCCDRAAKLCPGSPCAQRAVDVMIELTQGSDKNQVITMPNPKYMLDSADSEPGSEVMVSGLMKACHLLMSQGMHHEAAELARQAYALDPQRVLADPLIYKMHLLAESPATQPAGSSEASEPPTCPYCPNIGKPIREILPEKKKSDADDNSLSPLSAVDYEFEAGINDNDGLRMSADCSLGSYVYHLSYKNGSLAIWKTTDAGKTKP